MDIQALKELFMGWLPTITGVGGIVAVAANIISKFTNSAKRLKDEVCSIVEKHETDTNQVVKANLELIKENDLLNTKLLEKVEIVNQAITSIQAIPDAVRQVVEDAIYNYFEKQAVKIKAIEDALKKAGIPYDQIEENITVN